MQDEPQTIPAQLDHDWKEGLGKRFDDQDTILKMLITRQTEHAEKLVTIEENSKTAVEFFRTMDGAMKFFNMVGKMTKPILGAIAVLTAAWTAWNHH